MPTNPTNIEKGNALENAVRAIESTILYEYPGYREKDLRIEPKKIILVGGVRHEIDLHITAIHGADYDAIFIFECKNWKDKVGKNEIIVFAEKIQASNATRGFFVAKSYTADAKARAQANSRIKLLLAAEYDPPAMMVPANFHGLHVGDVTADLNILGFEAKDLSAKKPINLELASCVLNGNSINLKEYALAWINEARENRTNHFPSIQSGEGMHILEFCEKQTFNKGEAIVNNRPVKCLELNGKIQVHVSKAVVISAFDVKGRGRYITAQVDMPIGQVKIGFVELPQ